jgi:hypothetical protein
MPHSACTRNMTPFSLFPFGFRFRDPVVLTNAIEGPPTGVIAF